MPLMVLIRFRAVANYNLIPNAIITSNLHFGEREREREREGEREMNIFYSVST